MNRRMGGSLQQRPSQSEQRRSRKVLNVVMAVSALSILLGVWWGITSRGPPPTLPTTTTDDDGGHRFVQPSEGAATPSNILTVVNNRPVAPVPPASTTNNVGRTPTTVSKNTKDRTPSDPFVSGDLYRDVASIVIDETTVSSSSLSIWGGGTKGTGCLTPDSKRANSPQAGGVGGRIDDIAAGFAQKGLVAPPTDIANIIDKLKEAVRRKPPTTTGAQNTTVFIQTHLMGFFVRCLLPRVEVAAKGVEGGGGKLIILTHNSDYSTPYTPTNSRLKGGYQALTRALTSTTSTVATGDREGGTATTSVSFATSAFLSYFGSDLQGVVQMYENGSGAMGLRSPLVAWYGQNLIIRDVGGLSNFIKPLPIGIENRYNKLGRHVGVYEEMARAASPFADRKKTLLVSFSLKTNPSERKAARDAAERLATALSQDSVKYGDMAVTFYHQPAAKGSATPEDALRGFLKQLSEHQFVLAPKGHGVDTHRVWEAMYMGCVPIVLDSPSFDFPFAMADEGVVDMRSVFGQSFAHPSLPLWLLPNPFLPPPPYRRNGVGASTNHPSLPPTTRTVSTATSEGGVYSKYLTPLGLRSAQQYFSLLLARQVGDGGEDRGDPLSWLLAKFPTLSASHWRSKWMKG